MTEPVIPPPREDHPPLKVNVFAAARSGNCTLAPMFPYVHAGAMVPTIALFWGRANGDYGHFEHFNTVDEVAWYCPACETPLWRRTFDTATTIPQRAYAEACAVLNADASRRTCARCGTAHPPVDFPAAAWSRIAADLAKGG
jgi:hypothetical protein